MNTNDLGPCGLVRQGDVLLIPVDGELVDGAAPASRRVQERIDGRLVLAEGEATGHAHAILEGQARLEVQNFGEYRRRYNSGRWTSSRTVLIVEESPATLMHEEHAPLAVAPGAYLVRRQREYVPAAWRVGAAGWRRVAD